MSDAIDLPTTDDGKFYHIDCRHGDIARYVLACANPARAHAIAEHLEDKELKGANREYVVYTGMYKGIPLSVMGTGMGAPATAMAVVEAAQCQPNATFIRVGTCGAIQPGIKTGDLIITEQVIRDETTTHAYADPDLVVEAHPDVLHALDRAADDLRLRSHRGITCTTADFYAGQGRSVPGFPTRDTDKVDRLRRQGVLNFEMEMSVFLTLVAVSSYNLRAGGITVALCNRIVGEWSRSAELVLYEERCFKTGLRAIEILSERDGRDSE